MKYGLNIVGMVSLLVDIHVNAQCKRMVPLCITEDTRHAHQFHHKLLNNHGLSLLNYMLVLGYVSNFGLYVMFK